MPPEDLNDTFNRYVAWANEQVRGLPPLRGWRCVLHVHLADRRKVLAVVIKDGLMTPGSPSEGPEPDLMIELSSRELLDVLAGRVNPVERSLEDAIKVRGAVTHVTRLDALVTRLYLTGHHFSTEVTDADA